MFKPRLAIAAVGLTLTLGCGGLFVDAAAVDAWTAAVVDAEPDEVVQLCLVGASDLGLVNPMCGRCLGAVGAFSSDFRGPAGAHALQDPTCFCPSTCASRGLSAVVDDARDQRTLGLGALCDAEGPDPIFSADLAPLREKSAPVDYALVRTVLAGIDASDSVRQPLAIGLALAGAPEQEPTDTPTVDGADPSLLTEAVETLRACGEDLAHRLVVAPDGHVAAVGGPGDCAPAALATLSVPVSDTWRVVDVAWAASGMALREAADAPADAPGSAPRPAPGGDAGSAPAPKEPKPKGGGPVVRPGTVSVTGGLDNAVVQGVLRRHHGQIRYCYDRAIASTPTLAGTLSASIQVGPSGSVSAVAVDGGVDAGLDACVKGKLMRSKFPSPSGGGAAVVKVSYTFSPG